MAVTTSKPAAPATTTPAPDVHLELVRIKRYLYQNTLYEAGRVYVFDAKSAQHMLAMKDPSGLPVFTKAKPRTKMVEVPVELQAVSMKPVAAVDTTVQTGIAPKAQVDLGEDDPDLADRLAALDEAGEAPEFLGGEVRVTV